MHYQLRSAAVLEQLEVLMVGATFRRVNVDDIRNYVVVVPPPKEQALIADFLDKETARVDSVVGRAEKSIALLTGHRSALITAAVTGQIDVRDAA
jgi:type I restriction enzyme S subunit